MNSASRVSGLGYKVTSPELDQRRRNRERSQASLELQIPPLNLPPDRGLSAYDLLGLFSPKPASISTRIVCCNFYDIRTPLSSVVPHPWGEENLRLSISIGHVRTIFVHMML